jgi:hypothetical protein
MNSLKDTLSIHHGNQTKIEQQLEKATIPADPHPCLALFKATVKRSGNYDPAIREWETKPKADQTFIAFCPFIVREYSKTIQRENSPLRLLGMALQITWTWSHLSILTQQILSSKPLQNLSMPSAPKTARHWTTSSNSKRKP